jgi:phosphopantothenoylcysteine synthetase/decarboxylase
MASMGREDVLYCVVCGAPPAAEAGRLVELARLAGWDVCVVATPLATRFVDLDELAELSGRPVRTDYKRPGEPDLFPRASALVVAPATFNTINKLAAGIADTLALSLLCEYLALGTPIVVAANVGPALARHPQYPASVRKLQSWGARVLEVRSTPAETGWMLPWKHIADELPQPGGAPDGRDPDRPDHA